MLSRGIGCFRFQRLKVVVQVQEIRKKKNIGGAGVIFGPLGNVMP